ncbi:MAG TPA: hypothetical protein VGL82_22215 [Bryobacteraceae bacterium]
MNTSVSPEQFAFCFYMDDTFDAMMIAVRVLTAVNEKRQPDAADLGYLRQFSPPAAHLPCDELACEVIQQIIKQRAEVRATGRDHKTA